MSRLILRRRPKAVVAVVEAKVPAPAGLLGLESRVPAEAVGAGYIQGASVEGCPAARRRCREEGPGSWGLLLLLLGGRKGARSCLEAYWHSQCCSSRRMPLRESPGVSAQMAGLRAREACGPRKSFLWRAPSLLQALWTTNSWTRRVSKPQEVGSRTPEVHCPARYDSGGEAGPAGCRGMGGGGTSCAA
jgi:hypothetical protein